MEGLGDLGFWLAAGAVIVALIVRGWLRERDRQALIRDMMKAEGEGKVSEVLAYLREKDEADRKLTREQWSLGTGDSWNEGGTAAIVVAIAVSLVAFIGGLFSFAELGTTTENPFIAISVMTAFWVAGGIIAWLVLHFAGKKKNVSSPDA